MLACRLDVRLTDLGGKKEKVLHSTFTVRRARRYYSIREKPITRKLLSA